MNNEIKNKMPDRLDSVLKRYGYWDKESSNETLYNNGCGHCGGSCHGDGSCGGDGD